MVSPTCTRWGFSSKWIEWIKSCMSSMQYNFLVCGHEIGPIKPSRGLRQGDLISSYLFLLCAEGHSTLIQKNQARGMILGCKIANSALVISHLFFADDCCLFFRASFEEAECIKNYLRNHKSATGQQVNYQKLTICFSRN